MDEQATKGLPSGRPRKDTRALRDHWLKTRVTMDELHRVEQLARDAGKTPSEFFRDTVLKRPHPDQALPRPRSGDH